MFINLTQNQKNVMEYLIPLTFYHSVSTFGSSNMLTSFNTLPHMIFQWGNDIMSFSLSMGSLFWKKLSMADRGQIFYRKFMEEVLHRGLMIRSCQWRVFQTAVRSRWCGAWANFRVVRGLLPIPSVGKILQEGWEGSHIHFPVIWRL